jgi:hypothetical protein
MLTKDLRTTQFVSGRRFGAGVVFEVFVAAFVTSQSSAQQGATSRGLAVVAKTGDQLPVLGPAYTLQHSPSINNQGHVAFVAGLNGGEAVVFWSSDVGYQLVTGLPDPSTFYGPAVWINEQDHIAVRHRTNAGLTSIRLYRRLFLPNGPWIYDLIANSGGQSSQYDQFFPQVAVDNEDHVVYYGRPRSVSPAQHWLLVGTLPDGLEGTPILKRSDLPTFQPVIAPFGVDNWLTVVRTGATSLLPILGYNKEMMFLTSSLRLHRRGLPPMGSHQALMMTAVLSPSTLT